MRNLLGGSTGWAKGLAIFAALLVISIGLCGLNYEAALLLKTPANGSANPFGGILMLAGVLELLGMGLGALGVVICLLGLFIQTAIGGKKQKQ
jgi:hypothetical protein